MSSEKGSAPRGGAVLGPFGGLLRLEPVLAEGEALLTQEDPFLPLSDRGRFSRVLLGRIAVGDRTLQWVALKIQRGLYRPSAGGSRKDALANPQVERRWQREREILASAAGTGLVSLIDPGEEALHSLPVTFCRRTRAYFHPICPRCRGFLRDCRDDGLLGDCGLPAYSASSVRYLFCPSCTGSAPPPRVFYTAAPPGEERPQGGVQVRRRSELYRDWAAVLRERLPEEERRRRATDFPCLSCPHGQECYPPSPSPGEPLPAESSLVALAFHEFHLFPLEACELHYDEFADLLGGASWEEVRSRARRRGGPGREPLLAGLDGLFASPRQWLFPRDGTGRFALEVLRLKLALFGQLVRAVRDYHARAREPHLGLEPSHVMVRPGGLPEGLPQRWGFRLRLCGVSGARRFSADGGPELLQPDPDADPLFGSPFLREVEFGREETMRIAIQSVQMEGPRCRLEGTASSERVRLEAYRPGDAIRVIPVNAGGALEHFTFWGTLGERTQDGIRFSAVLEEGTVPSPAPVRVQEFDAGVAFYRRFRPPCDLYPLGLLLFRTLLVNDGCDVFEMEAALQRVLRKLSLWLEERGTPPASRIADALRSFLEGEEGVFGASAILYARRDREEAKTAVPERLWMDLLRLGFRLATAVPGFSFAAHHADAPADRPEELLERVLGEVAELEARTDVELFGRELRNAEIHEICRDLLGETSGPAGP